MTPAIPQQVETEIDTLIARYPQKRSAALMVMHALQDHFGYLSLATIEWAAGKLGLQPINLYELVSFYPMFRQQPAGRFQIKICRTLSCALAGSHELHAHLCQKLGLDPHKHGVQVTPDGKFSVEFVECLAGCDRAPVMMLNGDYHEGVTEKHAEALLARCSEQPESPR
jgi:NADH-quinone oxidoreductase subunit E